MTAILFGSISTLADTSELQREAFNDAFTQHGLEWQWDRDDYVAMLATSGGRDRVAAYAAERGEDVDADAVHATKSELFRTKLAAAGLTPRDGVVQTVREAKQAGLKVALVTTTSPENVKALGAALSGQLSFDDFDLVVDSSDVETPKPDGAAYAFALDQLGEDAATSIAVEDNVGGVQAAQAAGLTVVAFPNANTAGHDFTGAIAQREEIGLADLQTLVAA